MRDLSKEASHNQSAAIQSPFLEHANNRLAELLEVAGNVEATISAFDARVNGERSEKLAADSPRPVPNGKAGAINEKIDALGAVLNRLLAAAHKLDHIG